MTLAQTPRATRYVKLVQQVKTHAHAVRLVAVALDEIYTDELWREGNHRSWKAFCADMGLRTQLVREMLPRPAAPAPRLPRSPQPETQPETQPEQAVVDEPFDEPEAYQEVLADHFGRAVVGAVLDSWHIANETIDAAVLAIDNARDRVKTSLGEYRVNVADVDNLLRQAAKAINAARPWCVIPLLLRLRRVHLRPLRQELHRPGQARSRGPRADARGSQKEAPDVQMFLWITARATEITLNLELLTNTRLATLRQCAKKHWYRYELGMVPVSDAAALHDGGAYHVGQEARHKGASPEDAIAAAMVRFGEPATVDAAVRRESIAQLLAGYFWRYEQDDMRIARTADGAPAAELAFCMPLVNPETRRMSSRWALAGKIDAIVDDAGTHRLWECKTTSEDVSQESRYWLRLRGDMQISIYVLAARQLGFNVDTVIYDVTRKPTIRPSQIPLLDEDGVKIVLDRDEQRVRTKDGKKWRETGDTAQGWTLQTRVETPEEFGQRLIADIGERPDHYYARREIARTHDDLLECQYELWQQAQQLGEMRRHGRWYRNVTKLCEYCDFFGPCMQRIHVDRETIPSGFVLLENVNPELEEVA